MKTKNILLSMLLIIYSLAQGQNVIISHSGTNLNGLTINKAGTGLDISDGLGSNMGTAIIGTKAIIQSHSDMELVFTTNSNANNKIGIYNNEFKIGPSASNPEIFGINNGRLKFTGYKSVGLSSGIEFTNTTGTALRGFFGMADNGVHLSFWGYGNNAWNVRMNVENGYMGVGNINPQARLHINGSMAVLVSGFGSPLTNQILISRPDGVLETKTNNDIYTLAAADFTYRTGSTSIPADNPISLKYTVASSGTPVFYANLVLPNAVTLSNLDIAYLDNEANFNLEVCLLKNDLNGDNQVSLGCYTTSGTSAIIRKNTYFFPSSIIINNDAFQYNLTLRVLTPSNILTNWPADNIQYLRTNFYYKY